MLLKPVEKKQLNATSINSRFSITAYPMTDFIFRTLVIANPAGRGGFFY
jgi:hypothetical protein